jgi:hypothetical protein
LWTETVFLSFVAARRWQTWCARSAEPFLLVILILIILSGTKQRERLDKE